MLEKEINNLIYKYYLKYILNNTSKLQHVDSISEQYNPVHWVTSDKTITADFARFLLKLINDLEKNQINFNTESLIKYFHYYCLKEKKIIINEYFKKDYLFNNLFVYSLLFLRHLRSLRWLKVGAYLLSDVERGLGYFCRNRPSHNLVNICNWYKHEILSQYLIKCLQSPPKDMDIVEDIISGLIFQREKKAFPIVEKYLYNNSKDKDLQDTAINYFASFDSYESLEILTVLSSSRHLNSDNKIKLNIAISKLKVGSDGLIHMYKNTSDNKIKEEILHYYKNYRSKEFAKLLLTNLTDCTGKDEKIAEKSYHILRWELMYNLIKWFGTEVIDIFNEYDYIERWSQYTIIN